MLGHKPRTRRRDRLTDGYCFRITRPNILLHKESLANRHFPHTFHLYVRIYYGLELQVAYISGMYNTWGVQGLRSPNFFLGMEADRNVKLVGGDVAVL